MVVLCMSAIEAMGCVAEPIDHSEAGHCFFSSVSDWELIEMYSPTAIDLAPAACATNPARSISAMPEFAAAIPTIRLPVGTIRSLVPSSAARS